MAAYLLPHRPAATEAAAVAERPRREPTISGLSVAAPVQGWAQACSSAAEAAASVSACSFVAEAAASTSAPGLAWLVASAQPLGPPEAAVGEAAVARASVASPDEAVAAAEGAAQQALAAGVVVVAPQDAAAEAEEAQLAWAEEAVAVARAWAGPRRAARA
jgi:hypothetical protein